MKDFGIIAFILAGAYVISTLGKNREPTNSPASTPAKPNGLLMLSVPQNPGTGPLQVTLTPEVVAPGGPVAYYQTNIPGQGDIPNCTALPRAIASYQAAGVDVERLAILRAAYAQCPQ